MTIRDFDFIIYSVSQTRHNRTAGPPSIFIILNFSLSLRDLSSTGGLYRPPEFFVGRLFYYWYEFGLIEIQVTLLCSNFHEVLKYRFLCFRTSVTFPTLSPICVTLGSYLCLNESFNIIIINEKFNIPTVLFNEQTSFNLF